MNDFLVFAAITLGAAMLGGTLAWAGLTIYDKFKGDK